jgi:thiol:disulfide interchange protein DsbA
MKSFGVNMKIERARQIQKDLGLTGVPAFLVDGRYMTTPTMLNLPHGQVEERTLKVVEFLAAKAARERASRPKR